MRILREPVVQVLILGALLSLAYSWANRKQERPDEIVVTRANVDNLVDGWVKTHQKRPTQSEIKKLVDDYVMAEILYREAKALGLDENDIVIRRRLRQKMDFIAEDIAASRSPTEQDLQQYLNEHPDAYRLDAHITFEQIFFNEDRRGDRTIGDAEKARDRLTRGGVDDPETLGDGIPLPFRLDASSSREVSGMFGPDFASEILKLPVGEWSGPVSSPYGLHVVRVVERTPGRDPALAEVRDAVSRDWQIEQQKDVRERFYDSLRDRYTIRLEGDSSGGAR